MSTSIRPELSPKNCYWIEKHRYYELKHFCLQYPTWRRKYNSLICYPSGWPQPVPPTKTNVINDPITKCVEERLFYAMKTWKTRLRAGWEVSTNSFLSSNESI